MVHEILDSLEAHFPTRASFWGHQECKRSTGRPHLVVSSVLAFVQGASHGEVLTIHTEEWWTSLMQCLMKASARVFEFNLAADNSLRCVYQQKCALLCQWPPECAEVRCNPQLKKRRVYAPRLILVSHAPLRSVQQQRALLRQGPSDAAVLLRAGRLRAAGTAVPAGECQDQDADVRGGGHRGADGKRRGSAAGALLRIYCFFGLFSRREGF